MPFRKNSFFNTSRVTVILVSLAMIIAFVAFTGWVLNIELLRKFNYNWPSIKANSAIGILFSGFSLFLFVREKKWLGLFFATIVFLLGLISFSEHNFHFNARIDELLFYDKETPTDKNHGRMAQLTSIAFIIIGIALLTYTSERKWVQKLSRFSIILVIALSFAGFIGSLYDAGHLFRTKNIASFSIPTALCGLFMSIGILFSKPVGFLSVFQRQTLTARAGIRGILFIIVILIVIGWLCLKGENSGIFDPAMASVILITTFTISFLIIALTGIQRLNQSESQLVASEKNLRHVLSSTADVYYVIDRNYSITLINEMAKKNLSRAWGNPVKQGANILELIPNEKNEPIHQSFEKTFAGEKMEYELHQTDWPDLPEWVLVSYKPVIDNDGTVIGAYIVTKDITKSKKAEEELKQSNNRFELISRTTNDAIWEWDFETGQLWSNEMHQQLYGLSMMDPVPTEKMWAERIHPDDRQVILNKQQASLNSNSNVFISEYRFNIAGKGYRNIYDRCYIVRNKDEKAIRMMGSMIDVTDQKRIEEELRKSEQRYRSLIEQASDYIMITDSTGNFIDVNSSLCKTFGYTREELLSQNISQIIDPIQLKKDPIRFDLLLQGQSMLRERRMMNKDGTIIEVEANVKMLPDGRILAIARDIRERKRIEQELKEAEVKFRNLVEQSLVGVYIIQDGKFPYVNPRFAEIFGYTQQELINSYPVEIIVHPDDRSIVAENIRSRLQGEQDSIHYEANGQKKNKEIIRTEIFGSRTQYLGRPAIIGTLLDITEKQKAQQQIKKEKELANGIIESLPGLFYLVDETGKYLRWNKLKEIITGYTAREMSQMNSLDFFEEKEKEFVRQKLKEGLANGSTSIEAHIVAKNGQKTLYYFTGIAIEYEGKRCLMGTGIDISDRKKAEEQIKQSYEQVRQLTEYIQTIREEERTHIAREIHDELGQQLTVLKMDASWLNKKLSSSEEGVKQKLKDLLELLDGTVRTVRKISSELRPSLLDDMGLVAAMEWHLKEFERRVPVKTKFSMPQPDLNLSDTTKTGLFRIFQESLTNVARHADAKKVEVKLQQQNGNVILSIKDDGKGFDKEKAANKKTLGILGMEERSFMMGGSYQINSKPGEGTLVIVSVPDVGN